MNRHAPYVEVILAVALAYAFNLLLPIIWVGAFAALPLALTRKRIALSVGFLTGLLVPASFYLLYPLSMVSRLAAVMAQIASIPAVLVVVIFPLGYGLVMGLSGLLWSGLAENERVRGLLRRRTRESVSASAPNPRVS